MKNEKSSKKSEATKQYKYWAMLAVDIIDDYGTKINCFLLRGASNLLYSEQDLQKMAKQTSTKKHRLIPVKINKEIYEGFLEEVNSSADGFIYLRQNDIDRWFETVVRLNPTKFNKKDAFRKKVITTEYINVPAKFTIK